MRNRGQLQKFWEAIEIIGLYDLGYKGHFFTWYNGRKKGERIWEIIDRAFGNKKWKKLFPSATLYHEIATYFDHNPLFLEPMKGRIPSQNHRKKRRHFRFETFWLNEQDCANLTRKEGGQTLCCSITEFR